MPRKTPATKKPAPKKTEPETVAEPEGAPVTRSDRTDAFHAAAKTAAAGPSPTVVWSGDPTPTAVTN